MSFAETVRARYLDEHPAQAARAIEQTPGAAVGLNSMEARQLARLFDYLDPARIRPTFLALTPENQVALLESAGIRTTLTILRTFDDTDRKAILERLGPSIAGEFEKLLAFPADSAGAYMDRPIAQFRETMTVADALDALRATDFKRIRSIYVVDNESRLTGRVDMQDIAFAEAQTRLSEILNPVEGVAYLTSPRDDLVHIFDEYRTDSVPIIDQEGRLIGVVRYAFLFQAAEDEASVDIQKMVGASADERALSPYTFAVKKRLPWLHINLLTAFLAAAVVGLFESTIAQFTALAILLPVVAGQSGNAGSQALAVTMRGLALREISVLQWRPVLMKELYVGAIDGVALAITCGIGVFIWSGSPGLALVIGIAMITSMIAAGISGALVPITLERMGQDPATASSIILTTVTDVAGFLSFLGTATLLSFML